jgi:hypothetical protein
MQLPVMVHLTPDVMTETGSFHALMTGMIGSIVVMTVMTAIVEMTIAGMVAATTAVMIAEMTDNIGIAVMIGDIAAMIGTCSAVMALGATGVMMTVVLLKVGEVADAPLLALSTPPVKFAKKYGHPANE